MNEIQLLDNEGTWCTGSQSSRMSGPQAQVVQRMTNPYSFPHLFPLPPTIFPLTSTAKCKLLKGRGHILLVHSNSLCAQACSNLTQNKCQIKYSNIYWVTRQRGREETAQGSGFQTSLVHIRFEQPGLVISQWEMILNKIDIHNQWR